MSGPRPPIPGVRRFEEPAGEDWPDRWCARCADLLPEGAPPDLAVCGRCTDRARQRDAEPCVLCGADTRNRCGLCRACLDSEQIRLWNEGKRRS